MIKLKTLCFLLIGLCIFVKYSAAQGRTMPQSAVTVVEDIVNPETKRFESKAGNFSINISQVPTQIRIIDAEKGQEPGKQFLWQFERTAHSVMYSAFNKNDLSKALDEMNSGVRNSIGNMRGQIVSEKEISFGKYRGREFRTILPNGLNFLCRNYLVNNVGYLLTATYLDKAGEKEALEVLNSFKLLIEKK